MMVGRRQFIITIISSLLLFSVFYKLFSLLHHNDVDVDGFQNDPRKAKNNDNVTDIQQSHQQFSLEVKAQLVVSTASALVVSAI